MNLPLLRGTFNDISLYLYICFLLYSYINKRVDVCMKNLVLLTRKLNKSSWNYLMQYFNQLQYMLIIGNSPYYGYQTVSKMYWNKTFYRNWIWFNSNNDWKPDPMPKLKFGFSARTGNSRHYEYLCPLEQLKFHAQKINQSFPILPCKQGRDPLLSWQRICNVGYVTSHIFLYTVRHM